MKMTIVSLNKTYNVWVVFCSVSLDMFALFSCTCKETVLSVAASIQENMALQLTWR